MYCIGSVPVCATSSSLALDDLYPEAELDALKDTLSLPRGTYIIINKKYYIIRQQIN